MVAAGYAFRCNACGKCCNSSPRLTVPELFRFESRFIGALVLRRIRRPAVGSLRADNTPLTSDDVEAIARLAERLLFAPGGTAGSDDVAISVQGLDYPSRDRCPALGDDSLCTLHETGKPITCASVPLDAVQPDRLQPAVLASRMAETDFLAADCLVAGERAGFVPLTRGRDVVDPTYRDALHRQRDALAADKRYWGGEVYRLLHGELFSSAAQLARLPFDGFLTIAPVPLLVVLAGVSGRCRLRCLGFLDAQLSLIEQEIGEAIARKRDGDRPVTLQLRGFAQAYRVLRERLRQPPARYSADPARATAIEHWLGLVPCPASAN